MTSMGIQGLSFVVLVGTVFMNLVLLPIKVHLDGVVDDEVSRANRINLFWVTT